MRNVLIAQPLVMLGLVVAYLWFGAAGDALAAAYGVGIAFLNAALIGWRMARGRRLANDDARGSMRLVVASAIERLATAVALFALGFGVLDLPALPLLIGFIAGQAALVVTGLGNSH